MKEKLLGIFRSRLLQAQVVLGGMMVAMAGNAHAVAGGLKPKLEQLICSVTGNSSITMFAGAAAIVSFLVMFTLGEGKEGVATILKICIGISCLIFLPGILNTFFPGLLTACTTTGLGNF